jgi:DNA-directed RNA polymerase alpha subunit
MINEETKKAIEASIMDQYNKKAETFDEAAAKIKELYKTINHLFQQPVIRPTLPDLPLEDAHLSVRSFNAIKQFSNGRDKRVLTLKDLSEVSKDDFGRTKGAGMAVLQEIETLLHAAGLDFAKY